jgi:hypothetical protein
MRNPMPSTTIISFLLLAVSLLFVSYSHFHEPSSIYLLQNTSFLSDD